MRTLAVAVIFAVAAPALAAPPKKKPAPRTTVLAARPERIKQLHDFDLKWSLGLPIVAQKGSASEISNKWTKPFDVSPPVIDWVTDYGEAEGSAYRVRLSLIAWPDGKKASLYSDEQKRELFDNLFKHLYKPLPKDVKHLLESAELKALAVEFAGKIDEGGFDFPMKISVKG
jgi:hypothetical protein